MPLKTLHNARRTRTHQLNHDSAAARRLSSLPRSALGSYGPTSCVPGVTSHLTPLPSLTSAHHQQKRLNGNAKPFNPVQQVKDKEEKKRDSAERVGEVPVTIVLDNEATDVDQSEHSEESNGKAESGSGEVEAVTERKNRPTSRREFLTARSPQRAYSMFCSVLTIIISHRIRFSNRIPDRRSSRERRFPFRRID